MKFFCFLLSGLLLFGLFFPHSAQAKDHSTPNPLYTCSCTEYAKKQFRPLKNLHHWFPLDTKTCPCVKEAHPSKIKNKKMRPEPRKRFPNPVPPPKAHPKNTHKKVHKKNPHKRR